MIKSLNSRKRRRTYAGSNDEHTDYNGDECETERQSDEASVINDVDTDGVVADLEEEQEENKSETELRGQMAPKIKII